MPVSRVTDLHDEIAEIEARVAHVESVLEHADHDRIAHRSSLCLAIDQERDRLRELRQELYEEEDAVSMRERLSNQRWARGRML
jgi:hypothetical protein